VCTSIWKIAIPKDTLIGILEKLDADEDGFVTIGEVRDVLKRYGKDAKSSLKASIIRRKGRA
jgi:Ca2+-binding EF-hand superfamily protein